MLVEVNCETDFVAKTPEFQALVKELAMQIAAANPRCLRREDLPPEVIAQEREIYAAQSADKPSRSSTKSSTAKSRNSTATSASLEQGYVRDPTRTISDMVGEYVGKLGEKIEIRRFMRFQLGEGLDGKAPLKSRHADHSRWAGAPDRRWAK